jgi:hypothetical protein
LVNEKWQKKKEIKELEEKLERLSNVDEKPKEDNVIDSCEVEDL